MTSMMPVLFFFYSAMGLALVCNFDRLWRAAAKPFLRREVTAILGHVVKLPPPVTVELANAFAPLTEWAASAGPFFGSGDRTLQKVQITDARASSHEVLELTLRCRVRSSHKTESVHVILKYPKVVLVLWCKGEDDVARVLVIKKEQVGLLRAGFVLPHGRNVDGDCRGGCLQQLRVETGLSVGDTRRVEGVTLETDPDATNEICEFYAAEVPALDDLLDDGGQCAILPLNEVAEAADVSTRAVLFHSKCIFASGESGYTTPPRARTRASS